MKAILAILAFLNIGLSVPTFAEDTDPVLASGGFRFPPRHIDDIVPFSTTGLAIVVGYATMKNTGFDSGAAGMTSFCLLSGLFVYGVVSAQVPPTGDDPVRQFKQSQAYFNLVQTLGQKEADRMVLDVYAGWDFDKIVNKYVTDPNDKVKMLDFFEKAKAEALEKAEQQKRVDKTPTDQTSK